MRRTLALHSLQATILGARSTWKSRSRLLSLEFSGDYLDRPGRNKFMFFPVDAPSPSGPDPAKRDISQAPCTSGWGCVPLVVRAAVHYSCVTGWLFFILGWVFKSSVTSHLELLLKIMPLLALPILSWLRCQTLYANTSQFIDLYFFSQSRMKQGNLYWGKQGLSSEIVAFRYYATSILYEPMSDTSPPKTTKPNQTKNNQGSQSQVDVKAQNIFQVKSEDLNPPPYPCPCHVLCPE